MKTGRIWTLGLLVFWAIGFTACSDKHKNSSGPGGQIYPLIFEKDSIEIREGMVSRLIPVSSNGINTLDVLPGDTSLLTAHAIIIENGTSHASGWLALTGRRKGHTSLTVRDRVAGEKVVLEVKITGFYLGMQLREGNHPLFTEQRPGFLFLVDNDGRDFYLFDTNDGQPGQIVKQGSYGFSVENNIPYLTLTVSGSASCQFNLSGNSQEVYTLLNHFFHLGWEAAATPATSGTPGTKDVNRTMHLYLKEDATGKEASFAITDPQIPAGIVE